MNPAPKPRTASMPRHLLFEAVRSGAWTAQIGRAEVFLQKIPRTLVESTRSPGLLFCCAAHLPPARPSLLPSPKLTLAAARAGARGGDVSSSARRPRWRRHSDLGHEIGMPEGLDTTTSWAYEHFVAALSVRRRKYRLSRRRRRRGSPAILRRSPQVLVHIAPNLPPLEHYSDGGFCKNTGYRALIHVLPLTDVASFLSPLW